MKKITVAITLVLLSCICQAQTFDEWFRQKKTQKKYLIAQIAGLKVYAGYLAKGYRIGKEGLGTISRIKDGDFNLHRDFFGALQSVNPAIKKYPKVADILELQKQIIKQKDVTLRRLVRSDFTGPGELTYCKQVFARLLSDCDNNLEELSLLLQNGALELSDDERLQRIDKVYHSMMANVGFCKQFCGEASQLIAAREQEQKEMERIRKVNGLIK